MSIPAGSELLAMRERFPTTQALADHLGVARETVRDALRRVIDDGTAPTERKSARVEVPVIFRDYSDQRVHYVYPLGDVHLGAASHATGTWAEWLGYLQSRRETSLLGTGDFLNAGIVGSKSEVYDETHTVGGAKRMLRRQLKPLADDGRLDALAPGNHEERIYRAVGDCPIRDVCDSLEVPYVEASALLVYRVGDFEYEVFLRHGTGNGQALAGLAKSGTVIRADIYITGHIHRQSCLVDDFFVRRGDEVVRERRMFISSGSFLGYEKYAAVRGYSPGRIGAPRIRLDGGRHDVTVSL